MMITGITRKMWLAAILCSLVISLCGTNLEAAETEPSTFVVIGTESIHRNDVNAARKTAIANGLVSAVGLAVAEILPLNEMVTNLEKLNPLLYESTARYVQDYKVLAESRMEESYSVLVQVTVATGRLRDQLTRSGMLRARQGMPRVLFFVAERDLESNTPQYWWGQDMVYLKPNAERAMAEALREQGFNVIDHGPQMQQMAQRSLNDSPVISAEEALGFARAINADVVIIGRAIAEKAPNVMGSDVRSFRGRVDVQAYRTKSGAEIASISRTAVTTNVNPDAGGRDALTGAGSLAGETLAAQVAAAWQQEALAADRIEIELSGTRNLANFVQFRRSLSEIEGVEQVQVKALQQDTALLSVGYRGEPRQLADALMRNAFETFGINIYEVGTDRLKVELIGHAGGN